METGICVLSIVPLRAEPASKGELLTQLLFGETYEVLETQGDWIHIKAAKPVYEGWINSRQHAPAAGSHGRMSVLSTMPALAVKATKGNDNLFLVPGSICSDVAPDPANRGHFTFSCNGVQFSTAAPVSSDPFAVLPFSRVLDLGRQLMGAPYLWGGRTPFGIDCSGFTNLCFRLCGIDLPRDAWQQAEQGEAVDFLEAAQPGDLAFFDNDAGRITHVGILTGTGMILHASGRVREERIDNHGIYSEEMGGYSHKLRIVKRIQH